MNRNFRVHIAPCCAATPCPPYICRFVVVDRLGAATSTCTRLSALRVRRVALYALATYPGRDSNPHCAVCKTAARPSCCPGIIWRVGQDSNLRGADRATGLRPATISLSVTHPQTTSCLRFVMPPLRDRRSRTDRLRFIGAMLYRRARSQHLVPPPGIEPGTIGVRGRCSTFLSHEGVFE